jgi:ribosomal protein L16 Arg81 hydroxylase
MATEATTQAQAAPTTEDKKTPIQFSPEQQERINEIIRESMGRAGSEARKQAEEAQTQLQTLQKELEAAKAELGKAKTPSEKKDAKAEADALAAQIAEMKQIQTQTAAEMDRLKQLAAAREKDIESAKRETINVRKQNAIQNAASNQGFIDAEIVAALTADAIQYDTEKGRFFVLGENGQPRLNSAYEQMTLEEFYAEYAQKKPYLVRGDIKAGAGSSEAQRSALNAAGKYTVDQIFGKTSNASLANKLAMTQPKEYARLKAEAKDKGII